VGQQLAYLLNLLSTPVGECVIITPPISLQGFQTWHANVTVRQAKEISFLHKKKTS
jgi:hypothetical protein